MFAWKGRIMPSRFWLVVAFVIAFGTSPANPQAGFGGERASFGMGAAASASVR